MTSLAEAAAMDGTMDPLEPVPPSQALAPRAASVPAAVTPAQMITLALERGADVGTLERLLALQERWEASEARKAFVAALSAFKADPPTIAKNKHVSFLSERTQKETQYYHATLDQVANVIGAALSKHGLSHRWETEQMDGGMIRVSCILQHVLGHAERVTLQASPDQSGGKNNIQAVGSTVTYLQRYTLLAAVGLAAKDQDDDGRSGNDAADDPPITAEQKDELIALMRAADADTAAFLARMKVESLDTLPQSMFSAGKHVLETRRKNIEAKKKGGAA